MSDDDPPFPAARHVQEPGCARCPDLAACRERIAWGTGPLDAALVVVGEAPGHGDPGADTWRGGNWTGKAYTTRHSGRRVRELVADVGHRGDAYYTNAVKCLPCDGDGGTREPTGRERANCRPYLRRELDAVAPAAVLATGRTATASLLALDDRDLDGFLDSVLDPLHLDALDAPVLPLLHPSYADVWRARLGHDYESYVAAIRAELAGLGR